MKKVLPRETNVVEPEMKPAKTTTGYSPPSMAQTIPRAVQGQKEELWMTLIEQLWKANPSSDWVPVDVGEILSVSQDIWLDAFRHSDRLWELYNDFMQKYTRIMTTSALRMWRLSQESKPVIEPEATDTRFSAPDWQQNAAFDALKEERSG